MKTAAKHQAVSTKRMALIGVMTAIICITAPFAVPIPVSPVPISLTTLILYTAIYALGMKDAFYSYGVYLLLGFAGLPVFSGFAGGASKLAGPTGGYLIGFLFMIPLTGLLLERAGKSRARQIAAMALGTLVCYLFGTVWLCLQLNLDPAGGLAAGVIPYLPGDTAKIIAASFVGPAVAKGVKRA